MSKKVGITTCLLSRLSNADPLTGDVDNSSCPSKKMPLPEPVEDTGLTTEDTGKDCPETFVVVTCDGIGI